MPSGCKSHKYEAYVVFLGWEPGVYQTWAAARSQIFRCLGGFCKGYVTIADARRAYAHSILNGSGGIAIARPPDETIQGTNSTPTLTSARSTKISIPPVLREGTPTPTARSDNLPKVHTFSRPLSNTDDGGSPLHPLPPPPAPKTRSAHADHRQSYRRIPPRSDVLPSDKYDAMEKIIVVFRGKEPGVYFTKKAAMAGIGNINHPDVYFDFAADRGEAFKMYGVADMEGQLAWLT
ncbi:hypothetical protein Agabi119p4_10564 [Agaricus bisporus var. burnettii]|uniref:Ribonuclease H1 N-terminal domain-containing protein n=1 Tax=Agaricus bisporus var. burnettii TaxID=192524 RepID=A0A8H7EX27_AGABI|nr:hypothetical protein Agabi119p4_10564 [Agaricus bisporus var. burnettii]